MDETQICKRCETLSPNTYFFCPNCGKKLKETPLSTSFSKQVTIYLISFFLPPFGLSQGIKYVKENGGKEKAIGITIILLTIASISVSFIIVSKFMSSVNNIYSGQFNSYPGLGL